MVEYFNTLPQLPEPCITLPTHYSDLPINNVNFYRGDSPPYTVQLANTLCIDNNNSSQSQNNAPAILTQRRDNPIRSSKIICLEQALIRTNAINQIDKGTFLKFRTLVTHTNTLSQTQPATLINLKPRNNTDKNTNKRKTMKVWTKTKNTPNSNLNSNINSLHSGNNSWGCTQHSHSGPPRGTPGVQDSSKWKLVYFRFPRKHREHTCNEHKKNKENLNVCTSQRSYNRKINRRYYRSYNHMLKENILRRYGAGTHTSALFWNKILHPWKAAKRNLRRLESRKVDAQVKLCPSHRPSKVEENSSPHPTQAILAIPNPTPPTSTHPPPNNQTSTTPPYTQPQQKHNTQAKEVQDSNQHYLPAPISNNINHHTHPTHCSITTNSTHKKVITNTSIFKENTGAQDNIKKNKHVTLPYNIDLRTAQLNIQHMSVAKPFRIVKIMKEQNYDIMFLSELQVTDSITYKVDEHTFFIAGDTSIEKGKTKRKGKGKNNNGTGKGNTQGKNTQKGKGKRTGTLFDYFTPVNNITEENFMSYTPHNNDRASGVAIVVSPQLTPYIREIKIHTGRIMELILNTAGAPSHLLSTYAPHQGTTVDHLRAPFWNTLTQVISHIPKTHFTAIFGDLNVRLEAILTGEEHIIGPK